MKKNIFDPFMQINFENAIKESKPVNNEKNTYNSFDNSETLFMEKRVSFRTPQIIVGFVVLVTSESIGDSNKIGKTLLKDVVNEISDLMDLPEYIIFTNDAVKFLDENVEMVRKIRKLGTKIVISSESLNFFNISNKFDFASKLSSSDIAKRVLLAKKLLKL